MPGQIQSFSSYPGVIYSGDDFYILSSGLVRKIHFCYSYLFVFEIVMKAFKINIK